MRSARALSPTYPRDNGGTAGATEDYHTLFRWRIKRPQCMTAGAYGAFAVLCTLRLGQPRAHAHFLHLLTPSSRGSAVSTRQRMRRRHPRHAPSSSSSQYYTHRPVSAVHTHSISCQNVSTNMRKGLRSSRREPGQQSGDRQETVIRTRSKNSSSEAQA